MPQFQQSAQKSKIITSLLFVLACFILFKVIFLFVSIPQVWGFNLLHYLPLPVGILLTAIPLGAIFFAVKKYQNPEIIPIKIKSKTKAETKVKRKKLSDRTVLLLLILFFGILFYSVRISWPFLGDGTVYGGMLFKFQAFGKVDIQIDASAVLLVLYGIYYIFTVITHGAQNVFYPFIIVGLISGLTFVISSFGFAKAYSDKAVMKWFIFLLLISGAGTLFFFGYMEVYPLQYGFVMLYFFLAYQYLSHKTKLLYPAIVLLLCIAFHLQNILLIPSILFLLSLHKSENRLETDRHKVVFRLLLFAIPVMLGLYALTQLNLFGQERSEVLNFFIPFTNFIPSIHYTLLSQVHLHDLLEEHILIGGLPILLIISCLVSGFKKIQWRDPFLLFLLIALFFTEALLIGGNLVFGLARDWDICAAIGITLTLIAVVLFRHVTTEGERKILILPILSTALSGLIIWLSINLNDGPASRRFEDLMEIYTPIIEPWLARLGYENLRKYYLRFSPNDEIRTERKMIELTPGPVEVSSALRNAAFSVNKLSNEGKSELVRIMLFAEHINKDTIIKRFDVDTTKPINYFTAESMTIGDEFEDGLEMLHQQFHLITVDEAISMADSFIILHPRLSYGYEARGYTMLYYLNNIEGSIPYFQKTLEIDPNRTRSYLYLAVADARTRRIIPAKENFRRMAELDPTFMEGLKLYTGFMLSLPNDKSDIPDLEIIRHALDAMIASKPESELAQHLEQHNALVGQAEDLLKRVDMKMAALP